METVEGIDELHMSGARAVFKMKGEPDRDAIAAAFEARGMELVSFESTRRPIAAEVFYVDTGVT